MATPSPIDPFPRQPGEAGSRLILSVTAASDPERLIRCLKPMVERSRRGGASMAGSAPRSLAPRNPAGPPAFDSPSPERFPWQPLPTARPPAVVADIDTLSRTIEKVRQHLGCPHCCSGFDIGFQRELEAFARTPDHSVPSANP
jgi:hypothetical protein